MFMVNGLSGGGAEKILQTLINNLDRKKYDIIRNKQKLIHT